MCADNPLVRLKTETIATSKVYTTQFVDSRHALSPVTQSTQDTQDSLLVLIASLFPFMTYLTFSTCFLEVYATLTPQDGNGDTCSLPTPPQPHFYSPSEVFTLTSHQLVNKYNHLRLARQRISVIQERYVHHHVTQDETCSNDDYCCSYERPSLLVSMYDMVQDVHFTMCN